MKAPALCGRFRVSADLVLARGLDPVAWAPRRRSRRGGVSTWTRSSAVPAWY